MKWVRPVRPCWWNSENAEDLTEKRCVWESYWRVWKGWKCLLECSTQLTLQKGKSSVPQGHWAAIILVPGEAKPESLDCRKASLPSLQTSLPWVSINNHAVYNPSLHCLCVCMVHMQINTYGTCMEYAICVICHICGIFKSLHTYIYTALLLFFFPHTQWWKCFWKMKNYVCLFHWIQIQMLDSEKEVFIKNKKKKKGLFS